MSRERTGAAAAVGAGAGPDPEEAAEAALRDVQAVLDDAPVTLALAFLGGDYAEQVEDVYALLADRLQPQTLVGVTAEGVISAGAEIESGASLSVWAASLPGATCTPLRYPPPADPGEAAATWPEVPAEAKGLVAFADPFTFPAESFLAWVDQAQPGLPVAGGMASGAGQPGGNRLLLDGEVHHDGAVAVAVGGEVRLTPLVSQGCRPVGSSYVVTKGERNVIAELGGQPALQRIEQTYADADDVDRERMRGGLHIGLVMDEYADEHERGDFLVRGVIGADREQGAVAVGDLVRVGQTVRFHVRDADSADEDLRRMLQRVRGSAGELPDAALLFTCNGRGSRLFGETDHDAGLVHDALDGRPLAGFFAAGELGQVGGRNHVHGFTASLLTIAAAD